MAVVGTNMAAVVADVAAATVAATLASATVNDLAGVVMDENSSTAIASTHCIITSTGFVTIQEEGSVLRETCPSPACVAILTCY